MFLKLLVVFSSLLVAAIPGFAQNSNFTYTNGFQSAGLSLDGATQVTGSGVLSLTNYSTPNQVGHAFYPNPVTFKDSTNGSAFSFSTTFVFAIVPEDSIGRAGNGMAFVVAPQRGLPGDLPGSYLGIFNLSNVNNDSNHVFAVELDTIQNFEFEDINNNHVGVDINGLVSIKAEPAGYHPNGSNPGSFENLTLISGRPMQVWVEYDGVKKQINVTLAPLNIPKPITPLISIVQDLSQIVNETGYVGFSAATNAIFSSHCVLGWSFKMNGSAQDLDLSKLPQLPQPPPPPPTPPPPPPSNGNTTTPKLLSVGVPVIVSCFIFFLVIVGIMIYYVIRKRQYAELLEDWELEYGPHRFIYKDLYIATKGFREQEVVGVGGFGKVYKGILPNSQTEIAVKRVSHEAKQGIQEFVAEIVSLGRLRHRNLVSLLGYCRRKGELLLVYDYMPYGSLDKFLYNQPKVTLSWRQRFRVIKGVASGLFYLHEEWEQVVIHRDIKASNVLIDAELNGQLGDFGLARLYDHGTTLHTTNIMGTLGYLAPEFMRSGRATTATDVFAFGAFLLEVASGRRPVEVEGTEAAILVDWVYSCWSTGRILEARDQNMGEDIVAEEVEMVLCLGLMCSNSDPGRRPSMRQVVQYLDGDTPMPELSTSLGIPSSGLPFAPQQRVPADSAISYSSTAERAFSTSSSVTESYLSVGR